MHITEKNLSTWMKVTNNGKPNREAMQMARSLNCQPEFLGANNWQTPSTSKPGVVHKQQVYFAGFESNYSHGMKLNIECSCPATKECIHALKLQRVYCANWSYLFILFGMEDSERFGELWSRAQTVFELTQRDEQINQSRGITTEACGCRYNWNDKFVSEFCVKHFEEHQQQTTEECEREYQYDIYAQSQAAA